MNFIICKVCKRITKSGRINLGSNFNHNAWHKFDHHNSEIPFMWEDLTSKK